MNREYLEQLTEKLMKHIKNVGAEIVYEVMENLTGKKDIRKLEIEEMIKLIEILDIATGEDEPMSTRQRRMFFYYANQIGEENARMVLKRVTGKDSLKECTKKDMIRVIDELIRVSEIYPDRKSKKKKKRRSKKASTIKREKTAFPLPSKKMLEFLESLIHSVYGDNEERFENLCKRMIGEKRPLTRDEVWIMIQALKKIQKKWEKKQWEEKKEWIN